MPLENVQSLSIEYSGEILQCPIVNGVVYVLEGFPCISNWPRILLRCDRSSLNGCTWITGRNILQSKNNTTRIKKCSVHFQFASGGLIFRSISSRSVSKATTCKGCFMSNMTDISNYLTSNFGFIKSNSHLLKVS